MPQKAKRHNSVNLVKKHPKMVLDKARAIRRTNRWKRISEAIRAKFPLCQWPEGCSELSTSVHHIEPLQRRPELAYTETNLIPLCEGHHDWCNEQEKLGHSTTWRFEDWAEKMEQQYEDYFAEEEC